MSSEEVPQQASTSSGGPVSREEMYAEVWRLPMTKIADHHRVSSSFLARVCTRMNVPRPPRGHWVKLENGLPSPQPPLPEAGPGDLQIWRRGDLVGPIYQPAPKAPSPRKVNPDLLKVPRAKNHPVVVGALAAFEKGRVIDQGFLKPGKQRLVDVVVTKQQLEPALKLVNRLFLKLEAAGHRVTFAPSDRIYARSSFDEHEAPPKKPKHRYPALWSPSKPTVVFVGTVAIGLTLFEMTEELEARNIDGEYIPTSKISSQQLRRLSPTWSWTTRMDFATGRLCIRAFSPYPGTDWSQSWKENKQSPLRGQLDDIVQQLTDAAPVVARLVEEAEEQAKIRQQEWAEQIRRREERLQIQRQNEAREQARADLLSVIHQWDEIRRIQDFFRDAVTTVSGLSGEERSLAMDKLAQARELVGELNPLQALLEWKGPGERL